MTKRETS